MHMHFCNDIASRIPDDPRCSNMVKIEILALHNGWNFSYRG